MERFFQRWEHQERKWRDLAGHERETGQCLSQHQVYSKVCLFQSRWEPVPIEGPVRERLGQRVELRVGRGGKRVEDPKTR